MESSVKPGVARSKLVCPSETWPSLLAFLCARFSHLSQAQIYQRFAEQGFRDAHQNPYAIDAPYTPNAVVYYFRQVAPEPVVPFEEFIVYQDDEILIADKPPFLTVLPAGSHLEETLLVRLKKRTGILSLVPTHRIDRETSGLVMFTLNPKTRGQYQRLFEARQISKIYEALAPTLSHQHFPLRYASRLQESAQFMQMEEVAGEPNAISRIELIDAGEKISKYRISIETGKKHQIRAHMNALGAPILNDQIYPTLFPVGEDHYEKPLQLLAKELSFIDPLSHKERSFFSSRALQQNLII